MIVRQDSQACLFNNFIDQVTFAERVSVRSAFVSARMSVIQKSPFSVMDRFPDHTEEIRRLFKEEEKFRILCEDYRRCVKALNFWSRLAEGATGEHEAAERSTEYAELQQGLDTEILQRLTRVRRA